MLTNIVGGLPLESNLQIMVVIDKIQEPLQQMLALFVGHAIDVRDVSAHREDALPPSDGVRSDNGVDGLELTANILRSTARLFVELETLAFGNGAKVRLLKGCGESLEELLVRLADSIVDFVSRCPESIFSHSQHFQYVFAGV